MFMLLPTHEIRGRARLQDPFAQRRNQPPPATPRDTPQPVCECVSPHAARPPPSAAAATAVLKIAPLGSSRNPDSQLWLAHTAGRGLLCDDLRGSGKAVEGQGKAVKGSGRAATGQRRAVKGSGRAATGQGKAATGSLQVEDRQALPPHPSRLEWSGHPALSGYPSRRPGPRKRPTALL